MSAPLPRVPAQPLIDALIARGVIEPDHNHADIARAIGTSRWVVMRAIRTDELTVYAADRAARQGLGVHPTAIWGDAWLDQSALNDDAGIERSVRIDLAFQQLRKAEP